MAGGGAKIALIILSALGFWTLWGFPKENNLLDYLGALSDPGATVPGPTYHPMKQVYTGIGPVDKQLTTLVGFFYTATDGNRIDISLNFLNLGSQVLAAWILITTESYRAGNSGIWLLTSITIFGLLVAIVGYACIAPLLFALHLHLSPTLKEPIRDWKLVIPQPFRIALAPIAALIGFGIPSVLMALPAPSMQSIDSKLTWTAVQQFWPVWIYLAQKLLEAISVSRNSMLTMRTEKQKRFETVEYTRYAYLFALAASAGAHLLYVGLGAVAWFAPELLSAKLASQLHPENFWVPPNPFRSDLKALSLQDGALWFLQWDLIIGVFATMIWGVAVTLISLDKDAGVRSWTTAMIQYGLIASLVGPAGAAVVAIWGRDEVVFEENEKGVKAS